MTATDIYGLLRERRAAILQIAAAHGAHNVRVFGSVARGEAGPDSDIDLLVEVGPEHSSWFPAGLIIDLGQMLGRKVDVLTEGGLHWYIRDRVLKEAVPL
ncbi:MAG: nucleotidyltransferase family protein [Dehalococcoidia bacterium]